MPSRKRAAGAGTALLLAGAVLSCTAVQDTPDLPAPSSSYPSAEPPGEQLYRVDSVYDGDTLRVYMPSGESVPVRVLGIDAPEMRVSAPQDQGRTDAPSPGPECGAVEARDAARSLLQGKSVSLEEDPGQPGQDRYGRLLRYVQIPDAGDLAQILLMQGLVWVYEDFPVSRTPVYRALQGNAQDQEAGGWAVCGWSN